MSITIFGSLLLMSVFIDARGQDTCTPSGKMTQCSPNACGKYLFCTPGSVAAPVERNCSSATPYCSVRSGGDLCTSIKDQSNPKCVDETENGYKCTDSGYFPDPSSCRVKHICFNSSHTSDVCREGSYFDSKRKDCVKHASYCYTVDCTKQIGDFAQYEPNPQFYVYCYEGLATIYRCKDGEVFDSFMGCQFKCPRVGKIPHEQKQKYYTCSARGAIGQTQSCPGTSEFVPATGLCDVYSRTVRMEKIPQPEQIKVENVLTKNL